jgi:hypothetical protein
LDTVREDHMWRDGGREVMSGRRREPQYVHFEALRMVKGF